MATVISMINLKGGVGKTTTTVAVAEILSKVHEKKVLVIDLDPQTNATVALISGIRWKEKDERGETIYQMFKDKIDRTPKFSIEKAIEPSVSNLNGGIPGLDLLPSSLRLIDIQDMISRITDPEFNLPCPIMVLREHLSAVRDRYDYILIDCPPNLGLITLNGIFISDYYLIPTIPDILSTYGIPQILSRISRFNNRAFVSVKPLGIVVNLFRSTVNLHKSTLNELKARSAEGRYPRIFEAVIPQAAVVAAAADSEVTLSTLIQKYGAELLTDYKSLTKEIMEYAG